MDIKSFEIYCIGPKKMTETDYGTKINSEILEEMEAGGVIQYVV